MDSPAIYRIQVRGRLADQADLAGVLGALYESHFPLVSAECLGSELDDD